MAYQKKGYKGKTKGEKHEFVVKWIVKDKKIIKFVEQEEKTFKLADNVLEFLDEIKSNVPVNVTIADDKVIFIQVNENADVKAKELPEPEEKKVDEESKTENSNESYTVKAISKTRDYYLFDECGEKEWFTVAKNVKNFLKNVKKGDVLEIKYEITNDGKRDTRLINYAKVVSENVKETVSENLQEGSKTETKKSSTPTKYGSPDDLVAKAKNTACMNAKDIVIALIEHKSLETKNVKEALIDLTKTCYEAIQSL